MKTTIYTSALILALCCGSGAVAQNTACKTKSCPDSVLLSKRTDGNYEIRQYLVKGQTPQEADFTFHFPISSSQMLTNFSDNATVVKALNDFGAKVMGDTLTRVTSIKISGWASPDGSEATNQKLAKARAATLASYLTSQCPAMKSMAMDSSSAVATWKDCLPMLKKSSASDYSAAADIINGNHTEAVKEAHLMKLSSVWAYLKSSVLPQFRCAKVEFVYCTSTIVEQRVLIQKPAPAPAPAPATTQAPVTSSAPATVQTTASTQQSVAQNKPVVVERTVEYLIIEDKRNGVIIEMDGPSVDWN